MTGPPAHELESCIVNPLHYPGWDDMLLSLGRYSFFCTAAWARVLAESYGYNPLYFILSHHGEVRGILPVMEVRSILTGRRGVSLTFTDYCEPVVEEREHFQRLFEDVVARGKKSGWQSIELRGGETFLGSSSPSASYLVHELDLFEDEDALFARFRSSTKRNIRKAESAGVEVKLHHSLSALREFQRLNCITRKRHGLPPQPDTFFRKVHEHVIARKSGFVALAAYGGECVAGGVYFHAGRKALYKYGASDERYQHLRANNLVMWEAIRWCCRNGFTSFCFGRTDPENEGLRQFKSGWNTRERTIRYFRYDLRQEAFVAAKIELAPSCTNLLGKLPVPLLQAVGSFLYRHKG